MTSVKDYKYGIERAAKQLTDTADDLEGAIRRIDRKNNRTPVEMHERVVTVDKVRLLRGQAKIILEFQ